VPTNTGFPSAPATSTNGLSGEANGSTAATFRKLRRSTLLMAEDIVRLAREITRSHRFAGTLRVVNWR